MYKVVIIDDEPIVRKGIVNIINWHALGCEVVGEASNGKEGIDLIELHQPDIILTDINMPEMDGLEMIRQTIKKIPWSKIIVLTGYREFDYIQEALKLGATEYLLKPSKIDEITTAVKKACLELEYKNRRDESIQVLEEHFNRSLPLLKEKLLFDIVFSSYHDANEIIEEMALYEMVINEFVVVSVDLSHKNPVDIYQKQLFKIGIKNAFLDIFSDQYACETINVTQSRIAFIIQPKDVYQSFIEDIHKKAESFQVIIKSCFDLEMTLGISTLGKGWEALHEKMKECEQALDYKIYFGDDALILYDDIKNLSLIKENHNILSITRDILSAIKIGNEALLEDLNSKLLLISKKAEDYKNIYFELICEISKKEHIDLENYKDVESLHKVYQGIALEYMTINKNINMKNLSVVLKQSLEYIQNNYHESISLQDVADYTYVSIYYLSRMFKKEIGKNFVEYLNEFRINKAKYYLKDYELKTYEVAELVGITDPHYFSKLFKKYTGLTPTEYRNKV